jgi:hypothetical protein
LQGVSRRKQKPDQLALIGSESLAALAEFITRPQADPQIGAAFKVRRIPTLVNRRGNSGHPRPCAVKRDEPAMRINR